ncbi:serine protease [Streptomyces sp. NPDC050619]|uniref:serine protease n=1 Tax=Streptomyces sp. NPDC050619 TaxID=3157214 RepID=UPI00341D2CD1
MATTAPDDELPRGIARFWSADGQVAGCGFLIAERTLCTCAHVVADALGTGEADPVPPTAPVAVDFPLLTPPSSRLRATVTQWRPVTGDGGGDIALLTLNAAVPGTAPVRFAGGTAVWDHPFRVLGFPSRTEDHGVWAHGRLRAPVGKGWTSMESHGTAVEQGFSGAPVWDTEQGGVVGMTVAADVGTGATTAYLIPAALLLGLDPSLRVCPFRGLEPFREQDAAVFYARRADSERITAALRDHPFVPVAGASGVGKSSLVRAGVLPLLRSAGHTVTDFVGQPDTDPVRTLAEALGDQFPPVRHLARHLGGDPDAATLLGARILEHAGTAGHVILLDQFEETVGARPADARALLDVLLPMARAVHPAGRRLCVLATLRSASLEELVTGGRAEALSGTVQMIAPMTSGQLDEVVRRPIDAIPGVEFEPGLAELVVAEAGGEPGALPLVEFALAELWERQEHSRLTHAAYREIGGVEGALARYADHQLAQVCKAPGGPEPAVARRLFECLVRPVKGREYARAARGFDQLSPELRTTAQALANTRLLVIARDSSGKETVALAHEALVRQWPTLRDWLDASRAFLTWHEKLRGRLREWEEADQHPDLLLRGRELSAARTSAALRPAELSTAETEFIRLSRQHRRRSVRRGRTGVALVACLALLAGSLGYFLYGLQRDENQDKKNEAARALVEYAADRALDEPVDAALLAAAAHHTSDLPETEAALMRHAWPLSSLVSVHRILPEGEVRGVAAAADGRVMAVLKARPRGTRAYVVTGLDRGAPKARELPRPPVSMDSVAVSDDGTKVAAAAGYGDVRVWHIENGEPEKKPLSWKWGKGDFADITDKLDFSADGTWLLHHVESSIVPSVCEGTDLKPWVRAVKVEPKAMKGQGMSPPDEVMEAGECLSDIGLRSAEPDHLTVVADNVTTDRSGDTETTYAVRSVELSTGRIDKEQWDLGGATLGAGGRVMGTKARNGLLWQSRLPASDNRKSKGQWSEEFSTDATGRYLTMDAGNINMDGDPDALRLVMQDPITGLRRSAVLPWGTADGEGTVMTHVGKKVLAHAVLGRDVLAFDMRRTVYPLGWGGSTGTSAVDRLARGTMLVALTSIQIEEGEEEAVYEAVLDERGRRIHKADSDRLSDVVVSEDGLSFVEWSEYGWNLRTTADFTSKNEKSPSSASDTPRPDSDMSIKSVQRFGKKDFLLLDGKGLARIDGATGDVRRLDNGSCAWTSATSYRACVTAVGRPDHPAQFLVLRADGTAELRELRRDGSVKKIDEKVFSPLAEYTATGRAAVFRSDGRAVAVTTEAGVSVWRIGEKEPTPVTNEIAGVYAYDEQGFLVLSSDDGKAQLWKDSGGDPVKLYASDFAWTWGFDGHLLRGETPLGPVTYDLDHVAGRTTAAEVCGLLPPLPPGAWTSLLTTLKFPPDAEKSPPCPHHP